MDPEENNLPADNIINRYEANRMQYERGLRFGLWGLWDYKLHKYIGTGTKKSCRDAERALLKLDCK